MLDLGGDRTYNHSKRTAYIATRLGDRVGFSKLFCFYGGLLHDIGASGELNIYSTTDIHTKRHLIYDHTVIGAKILKGLPYLGKLSEFIKYHHEHYDGTGPFGLSDADIPLGAKILYIADQVDLILNGKKITSSLQEKVRNWVKENSGKTISPELRDPFLELAGTVQFWSDLEDRNLDYGLERIQPEPLLISLDEFEIIAQAFSRIVDNKSKFTHEHSMRVYNTAQKIARGLGYSEIMLKKIGIAALLHDIGKLMVPTEILEKPEGLTPEEFSIVKQHTYYTKKILLQIKSLQDIANWAANHHEKINGTGYPEGLTVLSQEDQIIAFADIYTALTENRPYRKGLSNEAAIEIIAKMVNRNELSADFFVKFKNIMLLVS
ncbi:HD domain-containing protein [Bacillota bacterium LX-D]|nr:HD domain-containing protein [Bacillota bacterium LX-D]